MTVATQYIHIATQGHAQVLDITPQTRTLLKETGLRAGTVTLSVIGSTGALTTCEFEPGLARDIPELMDKLIPAGRYHHDAAWGDGNGHSHLRASLVGPSLTLPFDKGDLILGTWQQIIFIDFDNRPRQRQIVAQFMGEA